MRITFINKSSAISDAEVEKIAEACHIQLRDHVAPAWNIAAPVTVSTTKTKGSYPFTFVDDIPEAPDALAYHDVQDDGTPAGKIGVNATLAAGESVSSAASHEAVELQCDIFCASWSFSEKLKCLVATEACDPVQDQTYDIELEGTSVEVSNFVTPYYFTGSPLGHPLDHLKRLNQTFEIAPGGYQLRMQGGEITDEYGEKFSRALLKGKRESHGRTFWRHVQVAVTMGLAPAT